MDFVHIEQHSWIMAHAHPSDGLYLLSQFPHARSQQQSSPTITSTETRPQHFTSPQQNCLTRKLQLRNAGFRGPTIPTRKVTPFTVRSTSNHEPFTLSHSTSDENAPRTAERRTLYGEDLPPSPVSILQEISNTSWRKRQSPQPSITTIFQDSTATKETDELSITSWYHEACNNPSPSLLENTGYRTMKLQEISLNEKTAPITITKVPKQAKERRKSCTRSRTSSFEATKYIEHLETELASINTKMDAITSPTRTKAQSTKLRALTKQTRTMREELSEWENKFDERVADEIFERSHLQKGLESRIEALEEDAEAKDIKIQELDKELEISRAKLKEMESLESTNQSLERRVDVLTELLAQSPTRANTRYTRYTSGNTEAASRTPRPKSLLLPSIPSSPISVRFSATYVADVGSWHGRQRASISTSSIAETPEHEILRPSKLELGSSSHSLYAASSVANISHIDNVISSQSPSRSRPISMISDSSNSSWDHPTSASAFEDSKSIDRPRKMRRFPSGSCSLKPLILPVTTVVTQSLPASAPVYSDYSTPFHDFSDASIDPTTAFVSKPSENSPFMTPTQPARRQSTSWAQNRVLDTLEDKSSCAVEMMYQTRLDIESSTCGRQEASLIIDDCAESLVPKPKRRSLQMELEQARNDEIMNDTASPADTKAMLESDMTIKRLVSSAPLFDVPILLSGGNPITERDGLKQRTSAIHSPIQPVIVRSLVPSPANPSTASVVNTASTFGIFSRLTSLMSAMRRDPLTIARKILVNAWTVGSSRLGGLGWWLIGLIHRSGQRRNDGTADTDIVEEEVPKDVRRKAQLTEDGKARKLNPYGRSMDFSASSCACSQHQKADDPSGMSNDAISPPLTLLRSTETIHACKDCVEPSSRRSLRLWLRFSLAIVLAVGVAVKDGPGILLAELPPRNAYNHESGQRDPNHPDRRGTR